MIKSFPYLLALFLLLACQSEAQRLYNITDLGIEPAGEPSPMIGNLSSNSASANLNYEVTSPKGLTWDRFLRDYVPNPVTITMILRNVGTLAAQGGELSLTFNAQALDLLDSNKKHIPDIHPGDSVIVTWRLTVRHRVVSDTLSVLLTGVFSNHLTITDSARFWVPVSGPVLSCCSVSAGISRNQDPMLFGVSVCVGNLGGQRTDTVFVRIELPPGDLKLAGSDAPNRHTKKILPSIMNPGQQGGVDWELSHPVTTGAKTYRVVFWIRTSNADSTRCEATVQIPGQATSQVRLRLDSVATKSYTVVRVPVLLVDTLTDATFYPAKFTVQFDDNCVQFLSTATPTNALLSGARFKTTLNPGRVTVELLDTMIVNGSGVLTELMFFTTEAPKGGIRICPLYWGSWLFDAGTLSPVLTDGKIRILDKPLLVSTATAPTITADRPNLRYHPMPFDVTVKVKNIGTITTDTIYARIQFERDLRLSGADAPNRNTKVLTPFKLDAGGEGTISWELNHTIATVARDYTIRVWVRSSNTDSVMSETRIVIPPLDSPILRAQCLCPDSLSFNEITGRYTPDPFVVAVEAANIGGLPAQSVRSEIILPPDVEFADSTETALKYYNPSTMPGYKGGPIPRVEWRLRYNKISRKETWLEFKFKTMGDDGFGDTLNAPVVSCRIRVSSVIPIWSFPYCTNHPDSVIMKPDGTGLEPNPITISWSFWNQSWLPFKIAKASIDFPQGDGLWVDPSTPETYRPDKPLNHGDTITFVWRIHVNLSLQARRPYVQAIVWDGEWNPVICGHSIPIAAVNPKLTGCAVLSDTLIRFNTTAGRYEPSRFVVEGQLTNSGNLNLDSVFVSLVWTDTTGLDLLEIEPGHQNPVLLQNVNLQQFNNVSWNVRVRNSNTTGRDQRISFAIRYRVPGLIDTMVLCTDELVIESSLQTGITSMTPQNAILHQNYPNPFNPSTVIEFELPVATHVRLAVFDVLGREVRELVNERRDTGLHRIPFDADGLPGGVYLYRLEAGGKVLMRQMAVVK